MTPPAARDVAAALAPQPASLPDAEVRAFQALLADISAGFVNLPAEAVDAAITDALRRCVLLLDVDRAIIGRLVDRGRDQLVTHAWAVEGVIAPPRQSLRDMFPWAIQRILSGEPVIVPQVGALPPEAAVDRANWEASGVQSNLTMPMRVGGRPVGWFAMGCLRRARDWPEELVDRVRVLVDVLANALAHKEAREALDASIGFEQLVSEILAALLTAGPGELDRVIEDALADMGAAFGAERGTLWQRLPGREAFAKSHRWLAPGMPAPPKDLGAVAMPWISARLAAGEVVRFASRADLPPEAAADLPALDALGVRAAVLVPLMTGGAVTGALSFATMTTDRDWPAALVPRVQLVGDVFAAALARAAAERREQDARMQATHAARVGMMGAFAASLVHELTQPVAASLANAETLADLLARPVPDLAEARAAAADILKDERHAGALIQQLRDFLRRSDLRRRRVSPRLVVEEVLRLVRVDAAERGIDLEQVLPDELPDILADRVQIEQVLVNLLLNAFDAVAANARGARRVRLALRGHGARLCFEVTDAGPGLDAAARERIFEPFFTTKPGGMGLGLAISRTIAAAHGGALDVASARGAGATFTLTLPIAPDAAPAEPPPPAAPATQPSGTVFVIDDDPSMRRALERQLQGAGHAVETFASAAEYLARAPLAGAACIVSDVRMPGVSGLELHASLVAAGRDLPIVFMSGQGDVSTTVNAMRAGAVDFLAKPFTRAQLLAAVATALAQAREQGAARRQHADLESRHASLTPREREVFALVAAGTLNKVIADRLGVSEQTVKVHRGRVMEKMAAASVADLVRMAQRLGT